MFLAVRECSWLFGVVQGTATVEKVLQLHVFNSKLLG